MDVAAIPAQESQARGHGPVTRARASLRAIEALDRLQAGGAPSAADLADLAGWAGWGPMAAAFAADRSGGWKEIGERLEWLLPPDQLREAQQATPNAFYTPPALAATCWQILCGLGFTGGKVLEPGCGAGAFIAAAPAGVRVEWTGVERDPVTARIAGLLHPSATIISKRLQDAALPAHSADAVIGNVPFGEVAVYDPTAPSHVTRSLHNYSIWRAARTLRPGGVAVLITSRFTMDSRDAASRMAIAAEADLVGAIRMPGDALAPGGTDVVADILVLRRRESDSPPAGADWMQTVLLAEVLPEYPWRYDDRVNEWFSSHPRFVVGQFQPDLTAPYGRSVRVRWPADVRPADEAIAEAAAALVRGARSQGLTWEPARVEVPRAGEVDIPQRADGRKELSFHLDGGEIVQVRDGVLRPADVKGRDRAELTALIGLRDITAELLDAEADYDLDEDTLQPLRVRLNAAYDRYLANWGPLNRATVTQGDPDPETGLVTVKRRRPRMGGFRQDPDYVTVLALEDCDDDTERCAKAPIFSRRVNLRPERPDSAETPGEAIRVCLDTLGRLDLDLIARLLTVDPGEVPGKLAGLAYLDPQAGRWVTAEEYLSGNVRDKLVAARAAAAGDPAAEPGPGGWPANVSALEAVQPADLGPDEIRAKLGAPWIPASDVQAFATETLGHPPDVTHLSLTAQWEVRIERSRADTPAATAEWGTGRVDGYRLLELALNGRAPVVYDTISAPDGEIKVRNQAETLLAEEKQHALAARFAQWAWEDPARCDRLCAEYNRRFNSVVLRQFDGSHLTFPGLAGGFTPYPHQLNMVHRIICSPASLCPYPVGAGKTPIMFLAARKLKELGLAAKPLIIVPNHLLEQTAREGKRLFPSARILIAGREDLADAKARKLLAARCATGDWDAVVMTHSTFTAIPVHPSDQATHLTNLAASYRQVLAAEQGTAGRRTVKQVAKMIDGFETQARKLLEHRTDDGVWFSQLGVDFVMADEAHYFKNLGLPVRTDGFSVAASKRATDLDMKLDLLRTRGGHVAALFTGTPVSNSLLEMYVLQHYLHPGRLDAIGLGSADAWAATFVQFQTTVEVTPDGGRFRLKRRPAKFENVPELLTLFGEIADLRPPEAFALQRPEARHHNVVITGSPELADYVADLAERADLLRQVDPHEDNMLKICSDGRKAALDLGLVGITTDRPGKADAVIDTVARIYHATRTLVLPGDDLSAPGGGFQIVFCDLGTPSPGGAQVYGTIRAGLTQAGVPAGRIRFIHDAVTDTAKTRLFADCRAGKVSVLLGSTDKLGVGTNIQARCVAVHHVDAPWRPADVEQREGRALRPGNLNGSVAVLRYVSEKSFDSFMWQALERKARFIGQVLAGRPGGRDIDDIGDATLSYAEVKALATGNPLLLELAEVNAAVTRLRQLAAAHTRTGRRLSDSISGWQIQIDAKDRQAEACDRIAATAREHADDGWRHEGRQPIADHDVPAQLARLTEVAMMSGASYHILTWHGLDVSFHASRQWRQVTPVAALAAGHARLTVELNPAWTAKGQHWRIEREIASVLDEAPRTASGLRDDIAELRQRITDATSQIGEPFLQAADLEAARLRRDAIEQQIHDAAVPKEEATQTAACAAGAVHADPVAADSEPAAGARNYTITPPLALPDMAEPPLPEKPVREARPVKNPVLLARLDSTAQPLFSLHEVASPSSGPGRAARARRRTRGGLRPPDPAAPREPAVQPALFDLPAGPAEPARKPRSSPNRAEAPRR